LVEVSIASFGLVLIVLGFILAFIAAILLATKAKDSGGQTRGGGILLIGPFPIIFGTDRQSVGILIVLAIVLIALVLIFMFIPTLLPGR
jgi:uncharacterized protein (TIGR00304 family)